MRIPDGRQLRGLRRVGVAALALMALACSGTRTRLPEGPVEAGAPPPAGTDSGPDSPVPLENGGPSAPVVCEAPAPAEVPWYREAVFYEVFVRSFQDSDGDGVGDLAGLTSRLDYLQELGVTALWLMPISPSPSYHGYDVTDYRGVSKDYGTLEDFDALILAAKGHGIRVVLDLVMNHTSRQHPWFVTGKRGPDQAHHDWYLWSHKPLPWGRPWEPGGTVWHPAGARYYYGLFSPSMPDLNYTTPAVQQEMLDIADFWLARGAAGFRLDAARYLVEEGGGEQQADRPGTHAFWKALRASIATKYPEALLIGEVWTDLERVVTYFGDGDELQMVFGFDRADATRDALRLGSAGTLVGRLCEELAAAPSHGTMGSFLTNHDLDRLGTDVSSDPAVLKLGATLLLTLPGTPFIYYGDELGMANGPAPGDIAKRLPMRWDESPVHGFTTATDPWYPDDSAQGAAPVSLQAADEASIYNHYKAMIALRRANPALVSGGTHRLTVSGTGGSLMAVLRERGESRVVVVANLGKVAATGVEVSVDDAVVSVGDIGAHDAWVKPL